MEPLVISSNEAFPIYSQDPVSDVQPSIRSGRSVRDQCADVDPRGIQRSVLCAEGEVCVVFRINVHITKYDTN